LYPYGNKSRLFIKWKKRIKTIIEMSQKVVVCIPAYNEAKYIREIIQKAKKYADEVIVCDDGSSDNTADISKDSGALVITQKRNHGYGKSLRLLFEAALERNADVIITMDSDGQHDAEQIPIIIEPIVRDGFDMAIGSRFLLQKDKLRVPFHRSIGIKTITKLTNQFSYGNLTDAQSGFRAYRRIALESINLVEDGMRISTEILLRAREKNLTIKEVPISISYNIQNTSTHNFLSHGLGILFSVLQFISFRHPVFFYGLPGVVLLIVSGVFAYNALDLFSNTRFISVNMILLSISTTVIGIVLLATGSILFTIGHMITETTKQSMLLRIQQFITVRHPMIFYGLSGILLLIVSGAFAYSALEFFSSSRYVTTQLTNMLFVTAATAIIGIVLLATGSILFTIGAILKGRLKSN
jgi:glycosyltransferase involved in cell wall biosynthesis